MKIRIFRGQNASELEELVNDFIAIENKEIIKMDFAVGADTVAVMVTYSEHGYIN